MSAEKPRRLGKGLEALIAAGGKANSRDVLEGLPEAMGETLRDIDFEAMATGEVRWKASANFAKLQMSQMVPPLIKPKTPRGVPVDPAFLAATGEPPAVAAVAAGFGVPYAKVASGADAYTVDHGAGVFFVAPDGIAAYSSAPHDPAVLARDYRLLLAPHGTARSAARRAPPRRR